MSRTKSEPNRTYFVMLARPVVQNALVSVQADTHEDAVAQALARAAALPTPAWKGRFENERYAYDVTVVLAQDELGPDVNPELLAKSLKDNYEYMLLQANLETGEGRVVFQPWLAHCSDLMIADVTQDWVDQMQGIRDEGLDSFFDELEEAMTQQDRHHTRSAEVIQFMPYLLQRNKDKAQDGR